MVKNDRTKMEEDYESINRRQQRITELTIRLDNLFEQADNLPDTDSTKKSMLLQVNGLNKRVEFWQDYLESIQKELKSWDEEFDRVEVQLSGLEQAIAAKSEADTPDHPRLLTSWRDIEPEVTYQTEDGRRVRFSKRQIKFGQKYDLNDEHLKAIKIGNVAPKGTQGIIPSEKKGFDK